MARPPKLTDAEREQRPAADRERLKQAAEQLLTSDGWQRWVRLRSRAGLARLSLSNQLLVALARPDASFVAGFKAWLDLGYCVRKGEKAIRIIAPMPVNERDRATGEETGETIALFKGVSVFDAQQVEPRPALESRRRCSPARRACRTRSWRRRRAPTRAKRWSGSAASSAPSAPRRSPSSTATGRR
jgi:hypothetical protein